MEDPSTSTAGDLAELACADVRRIAQGFAAGSDEHVPTGALRAHIERCPPCRDAYHSAVVTAAQVTRARREGLLRESTPSVASRASVLGSAPRNARKFVLTRGQGAFLVFGFVAMVLYLAPNTPAAGVELVPLGGVAWAGEERIDDTREQRPVERNQSCMTGPDARARLDAGDAHVILEPRTAVALERVRPLRVRLFEGILLVRGTCVITSRSAVIEARGVSGWVSYDGSALRAGAATGSFTVTDPDGEHVVAAGSVWAQTAVESPGTDG